MVDRVTSGKTPFHEFGLDEAVAAVVSNGSLRAVGVDVALPAARAYVITVGTPVRDGSVSPT